MRTQQWPTTGDVILVQDQPTTAAQRELWKNRQPPTRKGEVVEVPRPDGSGFLTIDVGGEYGGVTYPARDFPARYIWKPATRTSEHGDKLLKEIRRRVKAIRSGWVNPQYGINIDEETSYLVEAFEKLDASLSDGGERPSDWQ